MRSMCFIAIKPQTFFSSPNNIAKKQMNIMVVDLVIVYLREIKIDYLNVIIIINRF